MIGQKVRRQIQVVNSFKAELITNRNHYEPDYYLSKLHEYNSFILKKEREIEDRQALARKLAAAFGILMLLILPMLLRPAYTGFIVGGNTSNTTVEPENLSFTNESVVIIPDINESIVINDTNVTIINDSGTNITQNTTLIGVKLNETEIIMVNISENITNVTLENITDMNVSELNLTENGTGLVNISVNLTEELGNLTENLTDITEPDITEPVEESDITEPIEENLTEPIVQENITVVPINLAPRGALPPQFMEPGDF